MLGVLFSRFISENLTACLDRGERLRSALLDPRGFAPASVLTPKSKADLAFIMHILSWLAVNGTAAMIAQIVVREQELRAQIDAIDRRRGGSCRMSDQDIVIYSGPNGDVSLPLNRYHEAVWASPAQIGELLRADRSGVSRHIRNIFRDAEVDRESNMQETHIASSDRTVSLYTST